MVRGIREWRAATQRGEDGDEGATMEAQACEFQQSTYDELASLADRSILQVEVLGVCSLSLSLSSVFADPSSSLERQSIEADRAPVSVARLRSRAKHF